MPPAWLRWWLRQRQPLQRNLRRRLRPHLLQPI